MASPHAVGVAALIISQKGFMSHGRLEALLQQTSDIQACPKTLPAGYAAVVGLDDEKVQTCQGGAGHTPVRQRPGGCAGRRDPLNG